MQEIGIAKTQRPLQRVAVVALGWILSTRPVKPFGNRDHLDGNNRYLSGLSG